MFCGCGAVLEAFLFVIIENIKHGHACTAAGDTFDNFCELVEDKKKILYRLQLLLLTVHFLCLVEIFSPVSDSLFWEGRPSH